jgi:phosphatidylglycerophosphate synthase
MYNHIIELKAFFSGPANQVTTVRALLTLSCAALAAAPELPDPRWPAGAAATAAVLDGVDGWLARRTSTVSDAGARFDMETDALLIMVLSLLAWRYGKAGAWVIAAGLLRYVFVAGGAAWSWLRQPLPRSRRRQIICVVQVAALIIAILPAVPVPFSSGIAAVALVLLGWSFLTDAVWLWRQSAI